VSGEWLDLEQASRGQRDVLALFIQLARLEVERGAHMSIEDRHVILFSDEFDKSLHPTASTAVLERLAAVAEQLPAVSIVVSTHNVSALSRPALLGVSRIFASRSNDDFRYIESLNSTLDVVSEVLGASFLDALKLKRLYLLVEGNHDELIIGDVLKDQIPEMRDVEIVNGGGVNAWSGIIANSLRFLDAPVLLVHDKRNSELEREWARHQGVHRRTGRLPNWGDTGLSAMLTDLGFRRHKGRSNKGDGELERLLWLLKDNVFDRDQSLASRIFVFGLECDDIVDLLPISSFPKARRFASWAAAHDDFDTRHPRAGGEKFKYEFGIKDRSVGDALKATMDSVHPELGRLCEAVRYLLDHGQLAV
jgi:hypothetical protein